MKTLKATKLKNGWLIEIIESYSVKDYEAVMKSIKDNKLQIKEWHKPAKDNSDEYIIAE